MKFVCLSLLGFLLIFTSCRKEKKDIAIPAPNTIDTPTIKPVVTPNPLMKIDSINLHTFTFEHSQTIICEYPANNYVFYKLDFTNAKVGAELIIQTDINNITTYAIDTKGKPIALAQLQQLLKEHKKLIVKLKYLGLTDSVHYYGYSVINY